MNFLAPLWLGAAALAIAATVALHFITTRRPPAALLPTARFVPEGEARASSRAARPTDIPLLLLRCVALLLLGAAFARPVTYERGATLVIVDVSRSAPAGARDSAVALANGAGAVILFDSSARRIASGAADSIRAAAGRSRGSLSAALVVAARSARDLARSADSVDLTIVSPLTTDELDAAAPALFAQWNGRVRLVRTAVVPATAVSIQLAGDGSDDPLRPAVDLLNATNPRGATPSIVRIVPSAPTSADSAAARSGTALVVWGRATAPAAVEGLWSGASTVVAPLVRLPLRAGQVVARWADGAPAAVERPLGSGCIREVGAGVPVAGDVSLQPAFIAVARSLLAACAGTNVAEAVSDSVAQGYSRGGAAAPATLLRSASDASPLAAWLVGLAALLLVGEIFVRKGPLRGAP
jgi:hypothetical protein